MILLAGRGRVTKERQAIMTDNITINENGLPEMMSVGVVPWHGNAIIANHVLEANEALKAANLDWEVEKRQIYYKNINGDYYQALNHFATVRADNEKALGIVTDSYKVLQNGDAFSFMDALVATKEAKYETCGSLGGGRKVWILAHIPGNIRVSSEDEVEKYLLLVNTHDGSMALRVLITPVRVVCQNTLRLAMHNAESEIHIVHTGSMTDKLDEARRVLQLTKDIYNSVEQQFAAMLRMAFSDEDAKNYFNQVLEIKETEASNRVLGMRDGMMALFANPTTDGERGTLWASLNAVTAYYDHNSVAAKKGGEKRFNSLLLGAAAMVKMRAHQLAQNIIATA